MMQTINLSNAQWTIEACGDTALAPAIVCNRQFEARMPGCVHSDLIRAGVIGHPNIGMNEQSCQWISRTDWRYRCWFDVAADGLENERVALVLDGLDTIAVIELNGQRLGGPRAMNMHYAHRLDARNALRPGENELIITLRGPVTYVEEQERLLGKRPVNGDWTPYPYIRKMASNFQWDWGPKVATCGIWRGARIEAGSGARIVGANPIVSIRKDRSVDLRLDVRVDEPKSPSHARVHGTLSRGDWQVSFECDEIEQGRRFAADIYIEKPEMWWPRGHGGQALYGLALAVMRDGEPLDAGRLMIGLRTARLLTDGDSSGSAFTMEVNNVPIFCKGANWIPEGLFPEDQSPARIRERMQQAADANMNMLRVWGGGTHEQPAFYEACDELGIMVWQDFMFACATYPEDDPYPALIEREAREAVSRLAHHPSVVLWCGGNENVLGYESWGWKQQMPRDQKWGEEYYFSILPRVVKELDPSRPYWPDSPHSSTHRTQLHPNDPDHGDRHTWDAKIEEYRGIVPRFCSEFGHQSPPCWATMQETWGVDQLHIDSLAMHHHQRATGGNEVWYGSKVIGGRWRTAQDFDEWLYQAHVLQSRAISIGIEWMRANQPRCMGALFWQFNDAWAGHSWSCIDSAGRKKPLWYAARRSFAPRLLTIQLFDGELRLCAINECPQRWDCAMRMRRLTLTGETVAEREEKVSIEPRGCWRSPLLASMVGKSRDEHSECIVAESVDGECERAWWFHQHDRVLLLPKPALEAFVTRKDGELLLSLRAKSFVRDAVIAVDRVDPTAEIDDNLITMLPGEERKLRIRTARDVDAATWISPPVFRCANEFSDRS